MDRISAYRSSFFDEPSAAIWESEEFRAHAYREKDAIRLDIERLDGKDGITWDELQNVKDACGFAERDALELYPARRDVINTGNWRHLFIPDALVSFVKRKN